MSDKIVVMAVDFFENWCSSRSYIERFQSQDVLHARPNADKDEFTHSCSLLSDCKSWFPVHTTKNLHKMSFLCNLPQTSCFSMYAAHKFSFVCWSNKLGNDVLACVNQPWFIKSLGCFLWNYFGTNIVKSMQMWDEHSHSEVFPSLPPIQLLKLLKIWTVWCVLHKC